MRRSPVVVAAGRSLRLRLLGAPTVWIAHFMAVYIAAEWVCRPGAHDGGVIGPRGLQVLVVVATGVAVVAIVALTAAAISVPSDRERPERGDPVELETIAVLLGVLFAFATVAVGAVAMMFEPC